MILTFEEMREMTQGAEEVFGEGTHISFARFHRAERELYEKTELRNKISACAAVQLVFRTDADALALKIKLTCLTSSRSFFMVDVFENNAFLGSVGNIDENERQIYQSFSLGEFEKSFALGKGDKTVRIVLPWTSAVEISELSLEGATYAEAVKRSKKMLAYGDSITQGYDAVHPSNAYIVKLADALDAEVIDKAMGGEFFFPPLSEIRSHMTPDYITVAYGTNDWVACTPDTFRANCRAFYSNLAKLYPHAKIFAITPIWRKDYGEDRPFGSFFDIERIIKEETADLSNVTVIEGFDFVPHDSAYFADVCLHPNDAGFAHYAENLTKAIRAHL